MKISEFLQNAPNLTLCNDFTHEEIKQDINYFYSRENLNNDSIYAFNFKLDSKDKKRFELLKIMLQRGGGRSDLIDYYIGKLELCMWSTYAKRDDNFAINKTAETENYLSIFSTSDSSIAKIDSAMTNEEAASNFWSA